MSNIGWKALKTNSDDLQILKDVFKVKSKFLVDENMGKDVVDFLKEQGLNVKHISEFGLVGHSDDDVFRCAQTEDRILVTHDLDFLDNRKFPININPGIAVIPDGNEDHKITLNGLLNMVILMARHREIWRGAKIVFNQDNTFSIYLKNFDTQRIEKTIYKLERNNAYYWTDK